jgi:hypothetical protein
MAYDAESRPAVSSVDWSGGAQLVATHGWDAFGNLHEVNRGGTITTLAHDPANNRLLSASTPKAGQTYVYNYSAYDARHRVVSREASHGTSWTGMQYTLGKRGRERIGTICATTG